MPHSPQNREVCGQDASPYVSPDQIELVVPRIDVQNRPNTNHVIVTASYIFHILMLQWHLAEQLKRFRSFLEHLLCCVEPIHKQRPATCPFMLEAVEHLDAA